MSGIVKQLSEVLGADAVFSWPTGNGLPTFEGGNRDYLGNLDQVMTAIAPEQPPAAVALPQTVEALSKTLALAAAHRWRVLPTGQGSKLGWGGLSSGIDLVVSTARLNRIVDHAVGDFTVTVESGLKLADLQAALAEKGQFLAIDPMYSGQATVGGIVATADTGSLRQRYGGLRDMLIGLQFARCDGALARAGGRVVKNVAGYDLMKLMTGAYGSLGILSELTFRLYPLPALSRSHLLTGPVEAVGASLADIRLSGLTPVALDALSVSLWPRLLEAGNPAEAAVLASHNSDMAGVMARFQGIAAGVAEQSERLLAIAQTHGLAVTTLEGSTEAAFWQGSASTFQAKWVLLKVGLLPSAIPDLLALLGAVAPTALSRLYASSGLGWIAFAEVPAAETIEKLRSHCESQRGFLSLLQAPKALKRQVEVWGYSGNGLKTMGDIKKAFDPHNLLSPGRFVGGL